MTADKQFTRRGFLSAGAAAAALGALSACSGGSSAPSSSGTSAPSGTGSSSGKPSSTSSSSAAPSGSSSTSVAPPKLATTKVNGPTLKIWADESFIPAYIAASKGFTDKYQVNVEFQPLGFNDILTQFEQAGPTGNGPDLIDGSIDWSGPLLKAGLIEPIDFGSKLKSLDPRAVQGYTLNGQVYACPLTIESINVYRNPKLIPEPVTSWKQFEALAPGLVKKGIKYPLMIEANAYLMIGLITAYGGYVFGTNSNGSYDVHDVGLDKPGSVASMTLLDTAVRQHWTQKGAVSADVIARVFPAGQAALHVSGPWQLDVYRKAKADFVIDPLPAGPGGPARPWLASRGWLVNKVGKQVDLAKTFLTEYWASDEPMRILAQQTQKESAWLPVKSSTATPTVRRYIAAAQHADPIPSDPSLQAYWPAVGDGMTLIFNQQSSPDKVMTNAQAKLVAATKSS